MLQLFLWLVFAFHLCSERSFIFKCPKTPTFLFTILPVEFMLRKLFSSYL